MYEKEYYRYIKLINSREKSI